MIQGECRTGLPSTRVFLWVDVRDVALAHVRALDVPEAAGQRFLVAAGEYSNAQIAALMRESWPEWGDVLPEEGLEDEGVPEEVYGCDNTKSREVLGLQYRGLKECVEDVVRSMLAVQGGRQLS